MKRLATLLLLVGAGTLCGARASAQEHPITWTLKSATHTVKQGAPFKVSLRAAIPFGWHLYSMTQPAGGPVQTTLAIDSGRNFLINGAPRVRDPDVAPDNNFQILTETYVDSVTFTLPILATRPGAQTLGINVGYQTCTDRYCLPPTHEILEIKMTVDSGTAVAATIVAPPVVQHPAVTPPSTAPPAQSVTSSPISQQGSTTQSFPLFLWLAAVMGALSLLTPCVFPMIPITVSYFTRTNEKAKGTPARNALIYAVGIVATFTLLGMAIAILVGAGGINRFAANPWINLLVTAIFVAFAFNLFGLYEIAIPSSLVTRLDRASRGGTSGEAVGIVLMGLTFTLTSFTCTAPFVGTLLVMAAQGNWVWPLSGLLIFSSVFALPFFLLALMPSAVAKLPKSGSWLQSVKVVMGFLELATAMKFLSNADMVLRWGFFTRNVVLGVWMVIALLTVAYLLGVWEQRPRPRPGPIRLIVALGALVVALYVGAGLRGHRLGELESFVPPPEGILIGGVTSLPGELPWMINDYPGGIARARAEHKQVMVDFTGYTCTNCRWMEANMFPKPEVKRALEKFVLVRLYTDGQGALYEGQQKMEQDKLGTVALPYYAIMDTLGNVKAQFLGMTRNTNEFVQFLSQGRSSSAP